MAKTKECEKFNEVLKELKTKQKYSNVDVELVKDVYFLTIKRLIDDMKKYQLNPLKLKGELVKYLENLQ